MYNALYRMIYRLLFLWCHYEIKSSSMAKPGKWLNFIKASKKCVLSISCPSANEFSAIFLLHLAQSSANSPPSFEGFRWALKQTFNWIQQQIKNFPIEPIVKIARFRQRYYIAESGRFLQWGSFGKFFTCCRICMKFRLRVCLKTSNDRGEFEHDRARCYKNISKKFVCTGTWDRHYLKLIYIVVVGVIEGVIVGVIVRVLLNLNP